MKRFTFGRLTVALGRALGRFEMAWGAEFDWRDDRDVQVLGQLLEQELAQEITEAIEREAEGRHERWVDEAAAAMVAQIEEHTRRLQAGTEELRQGHGDE